MESGDVLGLQLNTTSHGTRKGLFFMPWEVVTCYNPVIFCSFVVMADP
jgi:hypothetical protein